MTRRKGKPNGSTRQAQANHQDPGAAAIARLAGSSWTWHTPYTGAGASSSGPWTDDLIRKALGMPSKPKGLSKAVDAKRIEPEDAIPVVEETMPILAHRAARLIEHPGGARLKSVTGHGSWLEVDMDAKCEMNKRRSMFSTSPAYLFGPGDKVDHKEHEAPQVDCSCGFYAVPLVEELTDYGRHFHIDLLVELSGTVIEHELMYRAGHQRIVEARIPACSLCGAPTELVCLGATDGDGDTSKPPLGRCVRHSTWQDLWLTRDDLARIIPVPVTYLGEN